MDGACNMHFAALFAGLALSLVKRTQGKKVVNAFPPFLDLHKKVKDQAALPVGRKRNGLNLTTNQLLLLQVREAQG